MLKITHIILVHFVDFDNGINTDIGTLKKEKGGIFSKSCIESFKSNFLRYDNEVLFEMLKIALNDTYLGVTTPTSL